LDAVRRKRTDDLLSGDLPIAALFDRPGDPIACDLLVEDALTAHMRGSGSLGCGEMLLADRVSSGHTILV